MRLEHPKPAKIQQGAIFNCVLVPGYEDCPCHGIVLTARCDLEHGKYTVVNFLPVVRFSDWSRREMCYLIAKRKHKDVCSSIHDFLDRKNASTFIRDTFPLREIIIKETTGKEQHALLSKLEHLSLIDQVIAAGGKKTMDGQLIEREKKETDSVVKDLLKGKLSEYYFLDAVDVLGKSQGGYVILLRNMRTLSCESMDMIAKGVEFSATACADLMSVLTFANEPVCMITGVLRSPDIENLAQHFANLFVRIGLEDYHDTIIQHHQDLAKTGEATCLT